MPKFVQVDHTREFFISHDGFTYYYETGHWYRITCKEVEETAERPAGLKYSLAFFDPGNRCLVRFDNSHAVKVKGRPTPEAYDHWHRVRDGEEEAVLYDFTTIEQLLDDFFAALDRHLPPQLRSS